MSKRSATPSGRGAGGGGGRAPATAVPPPFQWPAQTILAENGEPAHPEQPDHPEGPPAAPAAGDALALAEARERARQAAEALARPPTPEARTSPARLPSPQIAWTPATVVNVGQPGRAVSPADASRRRSPGALFGANARSRISPHRAMLLRARTPPREERFGAPGSRRHRRYTNEQFLLTGKDLYDDAELKQLVNTVERTKASPWMYGSSHADEVCERLWEDFCSATEEEQEALLKNGEVPQRRPNPTRLDRRTRALLRNHADTEFGRKIFAKIGAFASPVNAEVKLVLTMPSDAQSSMHRKVCHALARYYGLKSITKLGHDADTPATIVVRKIVDGKSRAAAIPPVAIALQG